VAYLENLETIPDGKTVKGWIHPKIDGVLVALKWDGETLTGRQVKKRSDVTKQLWELENSLRDMGTSPFSCLAELYTGDGSVMSYELTESILKSRTQHKNASKLKALLLYPNCIPLVDYNVIMQTVKRSKSPSEINSKILKELFKNALGWQKGLEGFIIQTEDEEVFYKWVNEYQLEAKVTSCKKEGDSYTVEVSYESEGKKKKTSLSSEKPFKVGSVVSIKYLSKTTNGTLRKPRFI
jgi:hypothetical protein